MSESIHPSAPHHLPSFITAPDDTDVLMIGVGIFLIVAVLAVGNFYLHLHSLPERMAHKSQKFQFEIVAVLGLLSLFTHNHLYWVIGLFLAMIDLPDFSTPLRRIAGSVEKMAGVPPEQDPTEPPVGDARTLPQPTRPRPASRRPVAPRARCRPMLELLLCSLLTILPDYLYRRYRQGKRIGKEITLFSVWFELRFGIIACLMLTVALITMIFYYHPSTTSATLYYRTVPILPETNGRVAEVHVDFSAPVKKGDVIFRLDNSKQQAALETARRKIAEVDAAKLAAEADILKAEGQLQEAKGALQQATDELETKRELQKRNPGSCRNAISRNSKWPSRPPGLARCRNRRQTIRDDARNRASAGREGKCRGGAGGSAGRSGQDLCSGRRRWPRRAVPAAAGRCRQSDDTVGRRSDSRRAPDGARWWQGSGRSRRRS